MTLKNICSASIDYIRESQCWKRLNICENLENVQKINTDDIFSKWQKLDFKVANSGCLNIPFWEINDSKQDVKDTRITKRKHFPQIFGKTLVGIGNRDK